jgi:hypothetical protein
MACYIQYAYLISIKVPVNSIAHVPYFVLLRAMPNYINLSRNRLGKLHIKSMEGTDYEPCLRIQVCFGDESELNTNKLPLMTRRYDAQHFKASFSGFI